MARAGLILVGLGLVSTSLGALLQGHPFHQNYYGAAVHAPIALLIGAAAMIVAIFWRKVTETTDSRAHRKRPK